MPTYSLREEGCDFDSVEADSAEEALNSVDLSNGDYDTSNGTIWTRIYAINKEDPDDSEARTFTINPDEPPCLKGSTHDWQSPYEILGGLKENPGVWGHGGGVIIITVCMHCGCLRVQDTWAQNPATGVQGLESVKYQPNELLDEVAALANEQAARGA